MGWQWKNFLYGWLPPLIWVLVIAVGSSEMMSANQTSRFFVPFLRWLDPDITPAQIAVAQIALRKLAHVVEYMVLAVLLWRALRRTSKVLGNNMGRLALVVLLICACIASADEWHQSFTAKRTGAFTDVLIDTMGAVIGIGFCWLQSAGRRRGAPEAARP